MNHPTDCALCPIMTTGEHVYVDPATQARRVAAAKLANQRLRIALRDARKAR